MSCSCRALVDEELKRTNSRVAVNYFNPISIIIATELIEKKPRRRPTILLATYCPFCGKRISDKESDDASD